MTAFRDVWISCDYCSKTITSTDHTSTTAAEARADAKAFGAHVALEGGRDICKTCWAEGRR